MNCPFDSPAVCLTIPNNSPKEPSFKVNCSSSSDNFLSLSSYSFVSLSLLSSSALSFAFIWFKRYCCLFLSDKNLSNLALSSFALIEAVFFTDSTNKSKSVITGTTGSSTLFS